MTETAHFKKAAYEHVARVGKAIASPARLEILDLLAQAPFTVEGLARAIGHTVANTSQHLQVLKRSRLVDAERAGTYVTYRLAEPQVGTFLVQVRALAHARLAEIAQLREDVQQRHAGLEGVDAESLLERVRRGEVTVLDVRPGDEFDAGHLPGALSMPLPTLRRRLRLLSKGRDIVAYCRGPYCVMAIDAVTALRKHGFRAHHLEYGVAEWRARGWTLQVGPSAATQQ